MLRPCYILNLALLGLALLAGTQARRMTKRDMHARQAEAAKRFGIPNLQGRAAHTGVQNITFSNPRASEFWVDGTAIPEVDFDIGPSWSGLLPISSDPKETRKLFFWFFPPGPQGSLDDLIFWTNGGPGCSSLEGLLQENGPFSWSWGQAIPTVNQWSWTNLSSILFVEQPVGTGFSQGTPNITNEDQLAEQLVGFFQQFLEVFSELKGKKFYLSGESYAGTYIPYIANFIYENPGTLDLDLQGFYISDPSLSFDIVQEQIPAVNFVHKYENVFAFNQTFMAELDSIAATCNYSDYFEKHVTFPPKGLLPFPTGTSSSRTARGCDVWDMIFDAALATNPAFNIYRIFDTYPILWDVLGFPGSFPQTQLSPLYFDRADVKAAIHAPANVDWTECSNESVFGRGGDQSLPPAFTVLPNAIEKSQRSVIVHGLADFILIAEGTRIVLQNMTWNGLQGFQTPIQNDSFIVDGVGAVGTAHQERGLTYYEVEQSGHMVPQFVPWAAFQAMQFLLGFRSTP
ncbi:alpha/beta-hydrolase [Punctularia strigosozonata HHB-11173 SS5]|uniref:Carboxypeptidase n=1 Tax=Punctularia strigosozonata (strain HHB-11173) TaxID=741275 RepID=R7S379_PUNST|nr:alpha/beta-hydrolase [Punctularia strigosozonata HHB-11173 SS5]EIN04304.1 alpha/beta-hydrolase [Punctularia strigosozonata HHB-11173 SS5]